MKKNNHGKHSLASVGCLIICVLAILACGWCTYAAIQKAIQPKDVETKMPKLKPEITAMTEPPASFPCVAVFEIAPNEFKTMQLDNDPMTTRMGNRVVQLVDAQDPTKGYIVSIENLVLYQNVTTANKASMKNLYGPNNLTCNMPDGKILKGYAEKIYVFEENNIVEFIMDGTWYRTDISRVTIEIN